MLSSQPERYVRVTPGEDDERTLEAMVHLGEVCRILGNREEAELWLVGGRDRCVRIFKERNPVTRAAIYRLGLLREDQNQPELAESLFRQSYDLDRKILGADHPETAVPRNSLLRILRKLGKTEELKPLVKERISRLRRRALEADASAHELHTCAWELLYCEVPELLDAEAALPFSKRAVEVDRGQDANFLGTLAVAYGRTGDLEMAIETQERAIRQVRAGGPYNREDMVARLVKYKIQNGDYLGAATTSLQKVTSDIGDTILPEEIPGKDLVERSEVLMAKGHYEEAADALRFCLATRQKDLAEGHWLIAEASSRLGEAMVGAREFEEAEGRLLESYETLAKNPEVPSPVIEESIVRVAALYEALQRPLEATQWRDLLPSSPEKP